MRCFVVGCGIDNRDHNTRYSFHRIPKDVMRQYQWVKLIGRDPAKFVYNRQTVCAVHFSEDQFKVNANRRELLGSATPNINLPALIEVTNFEHMGSQSEKRKSENWENDNLELGFNEKASAVHESIPSTSKKIRLASDAKETSPGVSSSPFKRLSDGCSPKPGLQREKRGNLLLGNSKSSNSFDSRETASSGTSSVKRRLIKKMHTYSRPPGSYILELKRVKRKIIAYNTKIKSLRRTSNRRLKKISSLKEALNEVKKKYDLSSNAFHHLESTFSGVPLDAMRRMMLNARVQDTKQGAKTKKKYPKELKAFAMTLQFYSAKAYDYVRSTFNLALPAPSTIRKWLCKIDCSPGFTQPAIEALKTRANDYRQKNGHQLLCSLMLDEMSIKKEIIIERHSSHVWGYVDLGGNMDLNNDREAASHVLVLMAVGVNDSFKIPIGYFFINSMSGIERANIVREALIHLNSVDDMRMLSLTCDGPHVHFAMMKELGCEVRDVENLQTSFSHPVTKNEVYVIFDICHMLKLLRNNWASEGILLDRENNEIDWEYIEKLNKLQNEEGLYLGNKLRERHIQWQRAKMRVKIAAQTLSQSVADALKFLKDDIEMTEFQNCGPTIKFIENMNDIFDFLNSRHPYGFGMKSPMRDTNESSWKPRVLDIFDYIKNLKTKEGRFVHTTKKQVPVLGFLVSITSLLRIYEREVVEQKSLKYVLTYKFSQDHLELFFCGVRSRNSCNNPNCLQFMQTYRRMLTHIDIKNNTGNCIAQDDTQMLSASESTRNISNITWERRRDEQMEAIEEKCKIIASINLNELQENVVAYICGFVVNSIKNKISCPTCEEALVADFDEMHQSLKLIKRKSRGKLIYPSINVQKVGQKIEKTIRKVYNVLGHLPAKDVLIEFIMKEARSLVSDENLFPSLENHIFDYAPYEEMHKAVLIEKIASKYASIRIYSLANKINESISGDKVRDMLKRLVLFRHQ